MIDHNNIIVVDIDGVILTENADYEKCEMVPYAKESIDELWSMGYEVQLYTGRHILKKTVTIKKLLQYGIKYSIIIFGKPPARYYIDDRARQFTTWAEAIGGIRPCV